MDRILVTGGAGMIGSNLVKRLVRDGHRVCVADNLWRGKLENLIVDGHPVIDMERDFHQVDLCDPEACLAVSRNVKVVYHLADIVAGINFVFANELFLWRTNVLMNTHILDAAVKNNVGKYIYVGTACSYPKAKQTHLNPPAFKEEEAYPAEPESSYGWSKLMGEYEAELAQESGALEVGILRLHNVYGAPCELDPERSQVIPALCRKAIEYPTRDFVVWGSGDQRRAFVFVSDVVDALVQVMEKGINRGVIQIGPSKSVSIREIAQKIVGLSGKDINIRFDDACREGDKDRTADWSKAKDILGWCPTVDIDQGLERTYRWCETYLTRKENE